MLAFDGKSVSPDQKKDKSVPFLAVQGSNVLIVTVRISSDTWVSSGKWTGPDPMVHISFDHADGLVMMERRRQVNFPLIQGKVPFQIVLYLDT